MNKEKYYSCLLHLFALITILCSVSSCSENAKNQANSRLPNVIFILADDLGYGDLACFGHPYARTPNIDKLARQGLSLKSFYVSGTTCAPSRAAFMTAKHPASFQERTARAGFGDHVSITELLKKAGYVTGHFGKWHIGPKKNGQNNSYGIDVLKVVGANMDALGGRDVDIFDSAIDFIEKNKDQPFYMNIWGHISHFPVDPVPALVNEFKDLSIEKSRFEEWYIKDKLDIVEQQGAEAAVALKNYLADVYSLDVQIGRILDCLERLNLENETIIVFSSDNGPASVLSEKNESLAMSDLRSNMMGYTGKLRGGKHNQSEGGIRVPFIVRWPGRVPENREDKSSVVSALDYLPTICNIAGLKIQEKDFDGLDRTDVWLGKETNRATPLYWTTDRNGAAVSVLDGKWKMHQGVDNTVELYNLELDPSESNEVSMQNPAIVSRLSTQIKQWKNSL